MPLSIFWRAGLGGGAAGFLGLLAAGPPVPTVPVLTMLGLIGGSRRCQSDAPRTEFPISCTGNDFSSYG